MSEDAVLICVPVVLMPDPGVESTIRECAECHQQVWVSQDSERIRERVRLVCNICIRKVLNDPDYEATSMITKETRQRFHDMGMNDEQIDYMVALFTKMTALGIGTE